MRGKRWWEGDWERGGVVWGGVRGENGLGEKGGGVEE